MKLVINRSTWLRGIGGDDSYLLDSASGKRCCVGIYLTALGVSDDDLRDIGCADHLDTLPEGAFWLRTVSEDGLGPHPTKDATALYDANDSDEAPSERDREKFIASVFAKHGVTIKFEG